MRILSGVQPSGRLHLGNYFGAIRSHIQLQEQGNAFYFIADYHALTTVNDPKALAELTREVAVAYLSLGLDPARATFFRQSDVSEVTELAWILSSVTGMGLLERAHSYKDKIARGISPSVGLFTYPVLMAADILIYGSEVVPVGDDQVQHLEMTRDMARSFHSIYGEGVFVIPEVRVNESAKVPGTDGQKMSKSYGNTIEIFAEGAELKKQVMRIVTDSKTVEEPKDPDRCNLYQILKLFQTREEISALEVRYREGGTGYGDLKKELLRRIDEVFAPYRAKRRELLANPERVEDVLVDGARRARKVAGETMARVRHACGLPQSPSRY